MYPCINMHLFSNTNVLFFTKGKMYVSQVCSSMETLLQDFLLLEINSLAAINSGNMIGQTIQ